MDYQVQIFRFCVVSLVGHVAALVTLAVMTLQPDWVKNTL
jgi:hypothetical protein